MTTAETIIARLGSKPLVSPQEIADAAGMSTSFGIISAIQNGKLDAVKIGGRYVISRESAIKYICEAEKEASK